MESLPQDALTAMGIPIQALLLRDDAAVLLRLPLHPACDFAGSLIKIRGHLSPCPGVSPTNAIGQHRPAPAIL